jgi:uncharacterized membrane protein YozB (DUF420 family)/cytochrome oxidase Cu insertion factor (SCO1/SenC/PrrC family)
MFPRLAAVLAVALCPLAAAADLPSGTDRDPLYTSLGAAPDFTLTERGGGKVSRADLKGKVWVVSFFFTGCTGGCPTTVENMRRLQEQLAGEPDVVLVSITVFPAQDDPTRLRRYAEEKKADPKRWLFLTGDEDAVYKVIEKGFYQSVAKNAKPKPGAEIDHTFRVILVDRAGEMRGYVDGRDADEMARLGRRARLLAQRVSLPAVNAVLNASCFVLLLAGYLAIRARRVTLHIVCMLTALGLSALFLACYLYYHAVILDWKSVGFKGEGLIRPVYYAVLLSHMALAAVITPLALVTAYLGLRGRLGRHTALARWTLPLWLYVSVTGVLVYWMLYHLYPSA